MHRKRPCRICGRWFVPHPRVGDRQRVCGAADCQRERHRRDCQAWHRREAESVRRHRLEQRLRSAEGGTGPFPGEQWREVVRDSVGLEVAVILEELRRLLEDAVRDSVRLQVLEIVCESRRLLGSGRRDEMVSSGAPP
jgi:hypothetical protein